MKNKIVKWFPVALIPIGALALAGCWTPPNASVQPKGKPGLIQDAIAVESVKSPATVLAIDRYASPRTTVLKFSDGTTNTYNVKREVRNLDKVEVGDTVKVTVMEEVAVYSLDNGKLPDGTTAETLGVNARVLLVDPSYRLLTLQYPDGQSETLKPDLGTRMEQMESGDSAVVRPVEVTAIKVEKH
jgi:hypothetical protein